MRAQILAAVRALAVFTVLLGLAYPLAVTLISQATFGDEADGSLVRRDGEVVGSELLGQTFSSPEYFHGRPSAAGAGASGSEIDLLDPEAIGLDAAFPALFLALLAPYLRSRRALLTAGVAAAITLVLIPVAPAGVPIVAAAFAALIGLRR